MTVHKNPPPQLQHYLAGFDLNPQTANIPAPQSIKPKILALKSFLESANSMTHLFEASEKILVERGRLRKHRNTLGNIIDLGIELATEIAVKTPHEKKLMNGLRQQKHVISSYLNRQCKDDDTVSESDLLAAVKALRAIAVLIVRKTNFDKFGLTDIYGFANNILTKGSAYTELAKSDLDKDFKPLGITQKGAGIALSAFIKDLKNRGHAAHADLKSPTTQPGR